MAMFKRKSRQKRDAAAKEHHLVRSLASWLQDALGIPVLVREFKWAGQFGPCKTHPSSLVTLHPFCPGGQRRLVLNVHHPLILDMARVYHVSGDSTKTTVRHIAAALTTTAAWPMPLDLSNDGIQWKMAAGLICGPQTSFICPVEHQECDDGTSIAIWPRQMHQIQFRQNKALDHGAPMVKRVVYFGDQWNQRDEALREEWKALIEASSNGSKPPRPVTVELRSHHVQFITYAPSLPILLLAQVLEQQPTRSGRLGGCTKLESLTIATKVLISADKLFCLSLWFGVPLMDRTRTWTSSIRVDHVFPPPPTTEEIAAYQKRLDKTTSRDALEETMLRRARAIWLQAAKSNKTVTVCWSGGIDSTSVLVCLMQTASSLRLLQVLYDDASVLENPSFYQDHIKDKIQCIHRTGRTLSEVADRVGCESLLVTGELGDQLFGSDKCRLAFPPDPLPPDLTADEERFLHRSSPDHRFSSLRDPWDEALFPVLEESGLMAGGRQAWRSFFETQLSKAPFPIHTLFDLLWWLNFSCKWQNVAVRCLHDGGCYPTKMELTHDSPHPSLTSSIVHFFLDRDLECWSCIPEYHRTKFTNLDDWSTYKQPLKEVIHKFYPNENYRKTKTKAGSLNFDLSHDRSRRVDRILGLVLSRDGSVAQISSGTASVANFTKEELTLLKKSDGGVVRSVEELLDPWILNSETSDPPMQIPTLHVNPWASSESSAFTKASRFADEDERQRRSHNPVTAITLLGKCSALLPPELVKGKRVLDLGACLGAMCHWCLYHGANEVVAVEPQAIFCERMEVLLADASSTWPESTAIGDRYRVVCAEAKDFLGSCEDHSFDIVVLAGVLHCFQDPLPVLTEMARVATHVVIESIHTTYHLCGFDDTESLMSSSVGLLEMAPLARVNKAGADASFQGLAVVPSELLVRKFMTSLGYRVQRITLQHHPTENDDVLTYTGNRRGYASPLRYFLRCSRKSRVASKVQSLEECIATGAGSECDWTTRRKGLWTKYGPTGETRAHQEIGVRQSSPPCAPGQWSFDESVASRFQSEAEKHIPDYRAVVQSCLDAIVKHFGEAALPGLNVVDVGCAIGYTMIELLSFGVGNVHGYDISDSMLEVAKRDLATAMKGNKWTNDNYHLFLAESANMVPENPPAQFSNGELDAALINWTLHFIVSAPARLSYLRQIHKKLKPGGMLILTEKTNQDDTTRDLYYDWKARSPQNVLQHVIQSKRIKLKGVLETLPVEWYFSALKICDYENVVVLRAKFGFTTFLCYKPAPVVPATLPSTTSFLSWEDVQNNAHAVGFDGLGDPEPFTLSAWGSSSERQTFIQDDNSVSTFGYVQFGDAEIRRTLNNGRSIRTSLVEGMYFAAPGRFELSGGSGFISTTPSGNQSAFFCVGGPLTESSDGSLTARLPYIDGCTDSLLISPVVQGSPCLNHLHFPRNISQTQHTHPSARTGIVTRGQGTCLFVDSATHETTQVPLVPGTVFCIPRELPHAFFTGNAAELDIIAFHPDSDYGPTPTNHPMVNRTMVDGLSAARIQHLESLQLSSTFK